MLEGMPGLACRIDVKGVRKVWEKNLEITFVVYNIPDTFNDFGYEMRMIRITLCPGNKRKIIGFLYMVMSS